MRSRYNEKNPEKALNRYSHYSADTKDLIVTKNINDTNTNRSKLLLPLSHVFVLLSL